MTDCWTIGVRGDGSCPELKQHQHCHRCPVHLSAARAVLDSPVPAGYVSDWTRHFAQAKPEVHAETLSVLTFRVGQEWLALETTAVWEVTEPRLVHSLPHRLTGVVLGLVNVRGELLVCISLARLLDLTVTSPAAAPGLKPGRRCLLVIRREGVRVACIADEVDGIHRVSPNAIRVVPSTVARSASHSRGVMSSGGRSVGVLDDQRLFQAIQGSLA